MSRANGELGRDFRVLFSVFLLLHQHILGKRKEVIFIFQILLTWTIKKRGQILRIVKGILKGILWVK